MMNPKWQQYAQQYHKGLMDRAPGMIEGVQALRKKLGMQGADAYASPEAEAVYSGQGGMFAAMPPKMEKIPGGGVKMTEATMALVPKMASGPDAMLSQTAGDTVNRAMGKASGTGLGMDKSLDHLLGMDDEAEDMLSGLDESVSSMENMMKEFESSRSKPVSPPSNPASAKPKRNFNFEVPPAEGTHTMPDGSTMSNAEMPGIVENAKVPFGLKEALMALFRGKGDGSPNPFKVSPSRPFTGAL